jgi:CRP/FNR family transcriptional regulator, anaerobic regulatory protein
VSHVVFEEINKRVAMTEDEWSRIEPLFRFATVKKKQTLVRQGHPYDSAFFIQKGLLFSYRTVESGESQVVQFGQERHWFGDLHSFLTGKDALFSLEALEPCELWAISKADIDHAMRDSRAMETFMRLLFQTAYAHTLAYLSEIYSKDAEAKYERLRSERPQLLQRVPQHLIASYLGILPSSLSRIRNKKQKK